MAEEDQIPLPKKLGEDHYEVTSAAQFLGFQPKTISPDHVLLLRGHERESYKLVASLFRDPEITKLGSDLHPHFLQILDNFLTNGEAQGFIPEAWRGMDEFNKAALAQHHGVPTPILDWTLSPKIALFFATTDIWGAEEDGEIIAQHGSLISLPDEGYNIDGAFPYLRIPPACPRHEVQEGVFTYNPFTEDGRYVPLNEISSTPGRFLYPGCRFTIAHSNRHNIQKELNEMGVNYQTIYPDAEGLAKHHAWLLRHNISP